MPVRTDKAATSLAVGGPTRLAKPAAFDRLLQVSDIFSNKVTSKKNNQRALVWIEEYRKITFDLRLYLVESVYRFFQRKPWRLLPEDLQGVHAAGNYIALKLRLKPGDEEKS